MPVYEYLATDPEGNAIQGTVHGTSLAAVADSLAQRGLSVDRLALAATEDDPLGQPTPARTAEKPPQEGPKAAETPDGGAMKAPPTEPRSFVERDILGPLVGKIALTHLAFFFRQLATMLGAGVGMVQSLETLAGQTHSTKLGEIIREIRDHTNAGRPMSAGMQRYPEVFSPLVLSLVRAGERGGMLEETLHHVADYLESEIALRNLIRRETLYPKVVLASSIIVIVGANLVLGIVGAPFGTLWSPLTTAAVWIWLAPLLVAIFLFVRLGLHNTRVKFNWDMVLAILPGFSSAVRKFAMAKFGRAFGALYKGGVPIPEAIKLSADACGNEYIRTRIHPAVDHLKEGTGITAALRSTGAFNPIVLDMTQTGEMTGNLDDMLIKMSEFYEDEAATQVQRNAKIWGVVIYLCVAIYVLIILIRFYSGYFGTIFKAGGGE